MEAVCKEQPQARPPDETALVERARSGDAEAFGALYEQRRAQIYTFLRYLVRDREEAADLTQQVFVRAWDGLPRLRKPEVFGAWLHRIARNLARDRAKSARVRMEEPLPDEDETVGAGDAGSGLLEKEMRRQVRDAVAALRRVHPYEEPAFDLYALACPETDDEPVDAPGSGMGRVVTLDRPVSLATIVRRIKGHLGVKQVEVAEPDGFGKVRRIGVCAGAGGSLLADAQKIGRGIDVFFTGEMRHHDVLAAGQRGVAVILAGHTQTERPFLPALGQRLKREAPDVQWMVSGVDRAPSQLR